MVTVTLITVAVGMVVFRLDGLSASGRLRAAANQITAFVRGARVHARTRGIPALLEYNLGGAGVTLRFPEEQNGSWDWAAALPMELGGRARIERVLIERKDGPCDDNGTCRIRIRPDGRCRPHAIVLGVRDRFAVAFIGALEEESVVLTQREPRAVTFELLQLEMNEHEENKSNHTH